MEKTRSESLPPPPGVINSIRAGFDAIASHVSAILLPLTFDLFLWLGPRLSMEKLYLSILPQMVQGWRILGIPSEQIKQMIEQNAEVLPQINLFWFLRTVPIGISSLIFGHRFSQTPLGSLSTIQVSSAGNLFGWLFLLTFVGWLGGGIYFRSVSRLATDSDGNEPVGMGRALVQTILVSIFWTGIVMMIGIPVLIILSLLISANSFIAQIAILVFSFISMWVVVPLFFWPHGVFLKKQNVIISIFSSLRMSRFSLPTSSMFVLTILLLTVGLNYLWSIPPEDSWMAIVGIIGHAFVATALLAASFIYYRDMNVWLQTIWERMKNSTVTKQA
jgi:hypothetical protein